jgi:hypothetical protein
VKGTDDPRCRAAERRPETAADRAVARAGWKLFREYQGGWGVTLVWGLAAYDGMCRPALYQVFAFVGGRFAGTLAPAPMVSRTEGSLTAVTLAAAPAGAPAEPIAATFNRYAESDPLCCPSRTTRVRYRVEGRGAGTRIAPGAAETQPTAR